jgi:hypothetical protein
MSLTVSHGKLKGRVGVTTPRNDFRQAKAKLADVIVAPHSSHLYLQSDGPRIY